MSPEYERRKILTDCFMSGVRAAHPESCLEEFLPPAPDKGRVILLAAGKAAGPMMKVAARHYLRHMDKQRICGVGVTKTGVRFPFFHLTQIEAGHPLPDAGSQKGAEQALLLASNATRDDLVIVLLSGGASALWSAPIARVSLADKQSLTRQLLRSGAGIGDINAVRKHLSAIKGGRLALAASPARLVTLAISDVVGDAPWVIGSGPTVGDPSTLVEAAMVLARTKRSASENITAALSDPRNETPKPGNALFARNSWQCVMNGAQALAAIAVCLRDKGYEVMDLGDAIEGEARDVARIHAKLAIAQKARGKPIAILSGGELTVTLKGKGRGGPSQEYALALAIALNGVDGIYALVGDSDGCDGGEGQTDDPAGAFVFPSTLQRALAQKLKPATFLDNNDSGTFFNALGDLLVTGPTFTNVNDFRIILMDK